MRTAYAPHSAKARWGPLWVTLCSCPDMLSHAAWRAHTSSGITRLSFFSVRFQPTRCLVCQARHRVDQLWWVGGRQHVCEGLQGAGARQEDDRVASLERTAGSSGGSNGGRRCFGVGSSGGMSRRGCCQNQCGSGAADLLGVPHTCQRCHRGIHLPKRLHACG